MRAYVTLLALCLAATGGYASPLHDAPVAPPPVWRQWDDPLFDAREAQALERSPTVAQAAARVEEARALERGARAELWPTLDTTASAQRLRATDRQREQNLGQTGRYSSQRDLGADLRWEIDLSGARRAQRDAALARTAAAQHDLAAARLGLSAELARQYVLLRAGDRQQDAEHRLVLLLREQDAIDAALEREGLLAAAERRPGQSELAQRESSLQDGKAARAAALLRLRTLIDAEHGPLDARLRSDNRGPPSCRIAIAREIPVQVLAERPDVRAALQRSNAAIAETRAARRLRWPNLTLSGRGGWTGEGGNGLLSASNLGGQLLASLGLRLLDFGRLKAEARSAQARQDGAESALAETILLAAEEADGAIVEVDRALHAAASIAKSVTASREAADIARARWQAGLDSRRTIIAIERSALEQESAQTASEQTLCESQIRFALAIAAAGSDSAGAAVQASTGR